MTRRYPEEIKQFIADHVAGNSNEELAQMVNEAFPDFGVTTSQINAYKSNHGLKSGIGAGKKPGYTVKYPQEMLEYVKANAEGVGNQEMADRCKELFGVELTRKQMSVFKKIMVFHQV